MCNFVALLNLQIATESYAWIDVKVQTRKGSRTSSVIMTGDLSRYCYDDSEPAASSIERGNWRTLSS
jgi:hypothetical protein